MSISQQQKFVDLLKEMFQFEHEDLDFGIYKLMNYKRDEILEFLDKDLLPQVEQEFKKYKNLDVEILKKQLNDLEKQLIDIGVAKESSEKYKVLQNELESNIDVKSLENEVFSNLTNFFRRYYYEGDFHSLRRYKRNVYAIPYEGEEVKLHWANADQYYIKTSEYFNKYTFNLPSGKKVHFRLVEANTEKDNNQPQEGKRRRFILHEEVPLKYEKDELFIYFEYRPLEGRKTQKKINQETLNQINELDSNSEVMKELHNTSPTEKNKKRTILEKHLEIYTARNTFDYFIHKDLGKFLRRELDFFIKNEIIHIDDIDAQSENDFKQYISKAKVMKKIGHKIIELLAQIEDFQKKLWEKKKIVLETNYCITLDKIPEIFYEEICQNKSQTKEWIELFSINDLEYYTNPLSSEFLKNNKNLVLDTKFFDVNFKDKIISEISNLDDNIDGLLIHSENFQALNLLQEKYKNEIDSIHIDPPYNTETSGFLYKNNYKHSSWASMMFDRINLSAELLDKEIGSYLCHIDENEYELLFNLFEQTNIPNAGTIVWDKLNPMLGRKGIATQHEYIIYRSYEDKSIYAKSDNIPMMVEKAEEIISSNSGVNEISRKEYKTWVNKNEKLSGGDKAYENLDDEGQIYRLVSMAAPEKRTDPKYFIPLIHPDSKKPCPFPSNGWSRRPETMERMIKEGTIIFGKDETTIPQKKVSLTIDSKRQLSSIINDGKSGKAYLDRLGYEFPYVHPVSLYEKLQSSDEMNVILDFFAGSGTTGHAVINLNREDGGNRKYLLVEMGEYFETILKPRILKTIYSTDWKNGKPVKYSGSSQIIKYLKLESYEDTLNNIELTRSPQHQKTIDEIMDADMKEDYLLSYMLNFESRSSTTLANSEIFNTPFDNYMNVTEDTKKVMSKIDLVETFNYLIGINVKKIDVISGVKVISGILRTGKNVLIFWRDVNEVPNKQLENVFKNSVGDLQDTKIDYIYVNGDNHLENLKSVNDRWTVLLIEEEFKRLMFGV